MEAIALDSLVKERRSIRGLGSVINGRGITQSSVVRERTKISDDQTIMICIAMGCPDFAANDVKSEREDNKNLVTCNGF